MVKTGFRTVFCGPFSLVFLAYIINCAGDWINYVAAMQLLLDVAPEGKSGLMTAYFMTVRLLPPMLLAPMTGMVADSYDKRKTLAACNMASAVVVLGFLLVRSSSQLWLFFLVAFLQQSLFAQFDPVRRALVPQVVRSPNELKAATTTDAFAWSLMMMVGAASGGAIVAKFGRTVNFVADSLTYMLSAAIVMQLKPPTADAPENGENGEAAVPPVPLHRKEQQEEEEEEEERGVKKIGYGSGGAPSIGRNTKDTYDGKDRCCDTILAGANYLLAGDRHRLLDACFLKGSAALTWGLAELLEVSFATVRALQVAGGFGATLGLVYASSGLGCIVGPLAVGALTGTGEADYRKALVAAFALCSAAYVFATLASSLGTVLVSSFLRACSSSVVWIYSTLLVQLLCKPVYFGRVFAAEMAIFTAFKAAGLLMGGYCVDVLNLHIRTVAATTLFFSLITFFVWVVYFQFQPKPASSDSPAAKSASASAAAADASSTRLRNASPSANGIHENAMGTGHIYRGIGYEQRSNDGHISHGAYSDLRHMDEEDRGYEDEETQPLVI